MNEPSLGDLTKSGSPKGATACRAWEALISCACKITKRVRGVAEARSSLS